MNKSEIKKWDIGQLKKKDKRRINQGVNSKCTKYSEVEDMSEIWNIIKKE